VRRVVEDSQKYESPVLYANPTNFDENQLRKYWVDEPNLADFDIIEGAKRREKSRREKQLLRKTTR